MKRISNKLYDKLRQAAHLGKSLLPGLLLVCCLDAWPQSMSVNSTGALPDSSAMLDISSTDKGLLVPRMTQVQRLNIPNPAHGLMVYQVNANNGLYIFDTISASWSILLDSNSMALTLGQVLGNGNDAASDTIHSLGALGINTGSSQIVSLFQVDGSLSMFGSNVTGISGYGINVYRDGTDYRYMKNGFAGAFAGGTDFIGIFRWPQGTTGDSLPSFITSMELKDSTIVISGAASDSLLEVKGAIIAKGAVIDSLSVNSAYTLPSIAGASGQVLTAGTSGSVSWAAPAEDNLGDHTATQNVILGGNYLSGDGGNEGITVAPNGTVIISGATAGLQALTVNGNIRTFVSGNGIEFSNNQISITGNNGNSGDLVFETGSTNRMRLLSGGLLGIGNMNPAYMLDVNGTIRSGGAGTDGQFRLYSEQGATDYEVVFNPHSAMTQNTTYTLPANIGAANQVLTTDGSGALNWTNASGDGNGIYSASGSLSGNTTVTQAVNTLAFTSTAINAFSVDGTTFSVDAANNRVGIGSTAPSVPLHVATGSDVSLGSGGYFVTGALTGMNIAMDDNEIMARNNGTESALHLQTNGGDLHVHNSQGGTTVFSILDNGRVGIGTTAPQTHFHLNHPTGVDNGLSISNAAGGADRWHFYVWTTDQLSLYFNDTLRGSFNTATGAYSSVSDARFKTAILDAPSLLEKVNQLKVREYRFTGEKPGAPKHIGLIAQEVQPLFPELVTYSEEDNRYLMNYTDLGIISIRAIQEQNEIIKQMQQRIDELEQQLNDFMEQTKR